MKTKCLGIVAVLSFCLLVVTNWSDQFSGTWTWTGATNHAAALVEPDPAGFSDWRLPTRAEWQAAVAAGTVGPLTANISPGNYFWTADTQGANQAWAISIATDANGNVIPGQSGTMKKFTKGSSLYAIAVRP